MPVSFTISPALHLVVVRYTGVVTTEESAESFLSYIMSGKAKAGHSIFIDFRECVRLDVTFKEMLELVAEKLGLLDPYEATLMTAMVTDDDAIYAKCLDYQRLVSGSEKQMAAVFRREEDALAFLNISQEEFAVAMADAT